MRSAVIDHRLPITDYRTPTLLLSLLVLVLTLGSLHWIERNVVLMGRDASGYLETSLLYRAFATDLRPQTLFRAFVEPPYRTPALYIAAQPFLHIGGNILDRAQVLNVLLGAAVVALTYFLARTMAGPWTALLAAAVAGLLPMSAALARLFYTEIFLTACVSLALLALYRAEGFARRGWSLALGAALGIGLLVKWTLPLYVGLPLLWVVWRARRTLRPRWGVNGRAALWALLPAALFLLVWFLPNRVALAALPPGDWAAPAWFALVWGLAYALLAGRTPAHNLAAALLLAALLASLWYLPHSDFPATLLAADQERGSDPAGPWRLANYLRYLRYLYRDHFGPLAFWAVVPLALLPWLGALARRRALNPAAGLLWLSLLSTFLILSLLSQRNARNLAPLLPALAVLVALGLAGWPQPLRWIAVPLAVGLLAVQWALVTLDAASPLYLRTQPLWAVDQYVMPPAAGPTDPGLWVAPQILDRIAHGADGPQSLGVLVNANFLHRGSLKTLLLARDLPIVVNDLSEETASWEMLLSSQWLLAKDGDNRDMEDAGRALLDRVSKGDPVFDALYSVAERWPLPDGETVTLYRRTAGPGFPQAQPDLTEPLQAVAAGIRAAWSDHATLVYAGPALAVWVGRFDPLAGLDKARVRVLPEDDAAAWDVLAPITGTILLVQGDDDMALAARLEQAGVKALEVGSGPAWLSIVGRDTPPLAEHSPDARWGAVALEAVRLPAAVAPGQVLPVEYTITGSEASPHKLSLRLLDAAGSVLASADRPLLPTDRAGLFVPPQTPPGAYTVAALLYDPATLAPLPDDAGRDTVPLAAVTISPAPASRR